MEAGDVSFLFFGGRMLASLSVQISCLTTRSNQRSIQLKGLQLSNHFPFGLVEIWDEFCLYFAV